jgi:uncharacterized protein (TIGR02466 family)
MQSVKIASHEVRDIFPTPVIIAELDGAEALNEALRETILGRRAVSEGMNRSNVLGWHSDTKMLKWGGAPAQQLASMMMQLCGQHTQDTGAQGNIPRYEMAIEMWANVSPAGASNQYHAHPACLWSGVYYVDDGGDQKSSPLVILDPRYPTNRMYSADLVFTDEKGPRRNTKERVEPKPGRLVIFPSWLTHGVKPHSGPRDRISVAMNLGAVPLPRSSIVNLSQ